MTASKGTESLQRGEVIAGRYEVRKSICRGSTGEVYQVIDRALDDQKIALKMLYPHLLRDERVFARFRNEVLLTRALRHPNIIQMYDLGKDDRGNYFLTMQYVEGTSLGRLLRQLKQGQFTFNEVLYIAAEICGGLSYAHQSGVIHRDLKPDNLLISINGDVRVTDFGVAQVATRPGASTRPGEKIGTPLYMAPEQFREDQIDERVDQYSLGVLTFELLAGAPPFSGDNLTTVAHKHCSMPLPDIRKIRRRIPPWFVEFIRTASDKEPTERFESLDQALSFIEAQCCIEDAEFDARQRLGNRVREALRHTRRKRNSAVDRIKRTPRFNKAKRVVRTSRHKRPTGTSK